MVVRLAYLMLAGALSSALTRLFAGDAATILTVAGTHLCPAPIRANLGEPYFPTRGHLRAPVFAYVP